MAEQQPHHASIAEYETWMRLVPSWPQEAGEPALNGLRTRDEVDDREAAFDAAMENLSLIWRARGTPMRRLRKGAKLSWALRKPSDSFKPTLSGMRTKRQRKKRFTTLFRRIMRGPWFPQLWAPGEMGGNRAGSDLARDIGLNYRKRGEVAQDSPSLCMPVVGSMVNISGRQEPYKDRSYLSHHKDGYIRVYLGKDEQASLCNRTCTPSSAWLSMARRRCRSPLRPGAPPCIKK